MISVIELEYCIAGADIFDIVVSKLCHRKKLCSIILLKVDKGLEVGFYCIILLYGLIVYLWVEGYREFPLDAKEIT